MSLKEMNLAQFYRVATAEETAFYQQHLYPLQDHVFSLCSNYEDLYLTGGTALVALQNSVERGKFA